MKPILELKVHPGSKSQAFQESFVLSVLNSKKNGYFLEIGGADGLEASNTFLLENDFAWKGLALEWDKALHSKYESNRKTTCLCLDATTWNASEILAKQNFPSQIDYLQLDIDPANQTLAALINLPHEDYRFSIITFEHDFYVERNPFVRDQSRKFLSSLDYFMVFGNVATQGRVFEDWYIDARLDLGYINSLPLAEKTEASTIFYNKIDSSVLDLDGFNQ